MRTKNRVHKTSSEPAIQSPENKHAGAVGKVTGAEAPAKGAASGLIEVGVLSLLAANRTRFALSFDTIMSLLPRLGIESPERVAVAVALVSFLHKGFVERALEHGGPLEYWRITDAGRRLMGSEAGKTNGSTAGADAGRMASAKGGDRRMVLVPVDELIGARFDFHRLCEETSAAAALIKALMEKLLTFGMAADKGAANSEFETEATEYRCLAKKINFDESIVPLDLTLGRWIDFGRAGAELPARAATAD